MCLPCPILSYTYLENNFLHFYHSGYMSPEYAMQGLFSEKSDVFSFGVLMLEIISGRRNSSFYDNENALSLLGFVSVNSSFLTKYQTPFPFADTISKCLTFFAFHLGLDTMAGRKYFTSDRSRNI